MQKYRFFSLCGYLSIVSFFLMGCNGSNSYYHFLRGNSLYTSGKFSEALQQFLRADEAENPFVSYNLGLVYIALGEANAAHEAWRISATSSNENLAARSLFNDGVLYYQEGNYTKAYSLLKQAVRIHGHDIEIKKMLELTHGRISNELDPQIPQVSVTQDKSEYARVLDYVQRIEQTKIERSTSDARVDMNDW